MLTPDNEKYIRKQYRRQPVKTIAAKLTVPPAEVQQYIESIKTPEDRKRERLFRVVMIAFPFVLVLLLEIGLRIGGYGGDTQLFIETAFNGKPYYEINEHAAEKYFRTVNKEGGVSADVFEKVKSPNTYRIFCFGESSTRGYPYMFNGAFSGMLKDRLQTLFPEKNFEVINLGMTAISSYVVLDFARQVMEHQPDLLLIYTGHNEFYGAFAVGSAEYLGRNRGVIKAYMALQEFRTFLLMRDAVGWVAGLFGGPGGGQHGTLMQRMVRDREILPGGEEHATALENFRGNLEDIIRDAKEGNTAIIVGTLASNLRGLPPFVSVFGPETPAQERLRWEGTYAEAARLASGGDNAGAMAKLQECAAIDPLPAKQYFLEGQCRERLGDVDQAKAAYQKARDHDGLPFRAPTAFNAMIADLCQKEQIPMAPVEELLAARSAHGIIGPEMMLEHVHPNVDGYFTIAKAFFRSIADAGLVAPKSDWRWERDKTDAEYRGMAGVTEFDSVIAAARLYILSRSWPFTPTAITIADYRPTNDLESKAKAYLSSPDQGWEQAHVGVAEWYASRKEYGKAAEEYRAIIKALPFNVSPYLRLAQSEVSRGDTAAAESALLRSLQVEETFNGYQMLGYIAFNRGDDARAIEYLEHAVGFTEDVSPSAYQQTRRALEMAKRRSKR